MGWPVLGYLLGKNIGGVVVLISFRLTWDGCSSLLPFGGVLSFRSEAREVLGSETARFTGIEKSPRKIGTSHTTSVKLKPSLTLWIHPSFAVALLDR